VGALFTLIFSADSMAQTVQTEKNGAVAGFIRDKDAKSLPVGNQTTGGAANFKNKLSAERIIELEKFAFDLVNKKRAENNLTPIAWSDEIAGIARLHSENMVKFNFFGHRGADGKMVDDRADEVGLSRWTLLGENVAFNRGYQNPIETAVEKWMLSPTHRENILNDRWKESAIGIAVTNDGTYYFTQVFLRRK
jgi:uncharacterized protein YkwD